MFERLILVVLLAIVGLVLYQWYTRRQLATLAANRQFDPILQGLNPGIPAIVYFTTPTCIPCQVQQQPALERLKRELGEGVQIVQIDATQQPDAADRWGVMSAPTTFVLNASGYPNAVNHGVADEFKLKKQLNAAI
jgi:thiol-disulfide isomerase/thioredoxin